jgi:hypothetical protein
MIPGKDQLWAVIGPGRDTDGLVPGRWLVSYREEGDPLRHLAHETIRADRRLDDLNDLLDAMIDTDRHPEILGPT